MLYALGFVSGWSAILYQILWMRRFGLLFGSTAASMGVCLAAFMGGLGAGAWLLGRLSDRLRRPERLYGGIELAVGLYGLASPYIFDAAFSALQAAMDGGAGGAASGRLILKSALGALLLLPPTFLMGGTFPAAIRYLSSTAQDRGRPMGLFYAANTLGAAAGAVLLPVALLERFGMNGVTCLAAAGNGIAGIGAFLLPVAGGKTEGGEATASPYIYRGVGGAFFLSGFAALALETLYNRVLILTFGSSIYSYSFILFVYLLGMGLGSEGYVLLERRLGARTIFFGAQLCVFTYLAASIPFLDRVALAQLWMFDRWEGQFWGFHAANLAAAALVCGIPALGFGVGFPAALKALTGERDLGRRTGAWTAVNGMGSALGGLAVTFVLLPWLGSFRCFEIILALIGVSLILIGGSFCSARRTWATAVAIGLATAGIIAVTPAWDLRYFHTEISVRPNIALEAWREGGMDAKALDDMRVTSFKEGADGTVSIVEYRNPETPGPGRRAWRPRGDDRIVSLFVNGKVDASDQYSDMVTQSLLGHLPMQFRPGARSALLVGLGSGGTAAALARYPLERLDIVEISAEVVQAARAHFGHVHHGVLEDTRARVIIEDGRSFLSGRRSYDVIVNEPSNAWVSGAANLFTREYFGRVRRTLAPGGIFCQWFQSYTMSWENLLALLGTMRSEFRHLRVFHFSHVDFSGDLLILASEERLEVSPGQWAGVDPRLNADAHLGWIQSFNDLMRGYVLGSAELDAALAARRMPATPHTDDRPTLEMRGPKDLFLRTTTANLFRFVDLAPELTFEWSIAGSGAPEALGLEVRLENPAARMFEGGGLRVVTFLDESRTFLRRQSFLYGRWSAGDGGRGKTTEIFRPLRGPVEEAAHGLTISGFCGKSPESARSVRSEDGRRMTVVQTEDTTSVTAYAAWNCGPAGTGPKTFIVRYRAPKTDTSGARAKDLWSAASKEFRCRGE